MSKPDSLFRVPVEGDTIRRVVVQESTMVWRVDAEGRGDWYVVRTHIIAENPKLDELPDGDATLH